MTAQAHITSRDIPDPTRPPRQKKVELAVFDFDGTCINGQSPAILARYLFRTHQLSLREGFLMGCWGIAYKLHLPQNESWVRQMLFHAFDGQDKQEVDRFLRQFYDEHIAERFRPELAQCVHEQKEAGRVVMAVSASFQPIIDRMAESYPFDYTIATRMKSDGQGRYLSEVDGLPVEGAEKVTAIRRFANERYGVANWEIAYAYCDHYSDLPLLYAARNAIAVDPGVGLRRTAMREGWQIIDPA